MKKHKVNTIHDLFINLRYGHGAIWLENKAISLNVPKELQKQKIFDFIKENKTQLTHVLNENKIFSEKKFLEIEILIDSSITNYPLSPAQERLWFIEQYEEGTNAYHIPATYELDVNTDAEGLKYALQQIVSRHEILRSTIEQGDSQEQGIQIVHSDPLFIDEITITDLEDYKSFVKEDINRPFNLSKEYPIRVKLYTIESSTDLQHKRLLLINTHHIASDGWSAEIFQKELFAYYEAYIKKDTFFKLPSLEIQYKDYALWQKSYLKGEALITQLNYWKEKLSGFETLEFPTDYARPSQIDYKGMHHNFKLSKELSRKLRLASQHYGITLNSIMLSSISILLSKYTGQDDIVIGSVNANRHHRQTEDLIGFFTNTQANRVLLSATQRFEELILQVHTDQIEAQFHQDLPLENLVDALGVERDPSRHPIFQVMFGVQSFDNSEKTFFRNHLKRYQIPDVYEVEKFDISIIIDDSVEEMLGQISYATSLFQIDTISRLADHYIHLLNELIEDPTKVYSQITLLNPSEYAQIIYDWNVTDKDYLKDTTIHVLFEEQVKKTPNSIAVVFEGQELTYKALNEKSNQLANYIRAQYKKRTNQLLRPDTLIALCLEKSLEMVIGILGVLKAGGAYVPIDPAIPQERIHYILEDTEAALVLSQKQQTAGQPTKLPEDKIIFIDITEEFYKKENTENLPRHSQSKDLAYVIYTSGTTGKPKGVMQIHSNIVRLFTCTNHQFGFKDDDVWTLFHSYAFDFSVWELWGALTYGGKLIIISKEQTQDIEGFYHLCREYKVTVLNQTPSAFYRFADIANHLNHSGLNLRYIIFGGEALNSNQLKNWWNYQATHNLATKLINMYGITETTVHVTYKEITRDEAIQSNIGRPIADLKCYILTPGNIPVPIGVIGELYIGGAGLARGYLNRQDLTKERFVINPFATEADKVKGYTRLYKTGDLAKWLSDGNIEYIGRNDDQVKIRGYRIELGEIEHAMSQIEGIKEACVLTKEKRTEIGSADYLVGYYVLSDRNSTLDQTILLEKLSQVLPDYMLPAVLVAMETFPLTINGKLDKRSLPDPDFSLSEEGYVKPESELEIRLSCIYAEVLGLASDQVSLYQNFFRMGGNSILTIQLKQKLNKLNEFKNISVADLFKYNSIAKLIQSIQANNLTSFKFQEDGLIKKQEIAVIGMSGAYSGVENMSEFWKLIENRQEGIRFHSKVECKELGIDESLLEESDYIPVSGQVKNIDQFDPGFWEISLNEAKLLDPQIRKFIEHCWFALESSGYVHQRKNFNIGVFAGSGSSDYFQEHILNGEMAGQIGTWEALASTSKDALATKTAFLLGLSGPAISINTACSTGLVAVVEACQKLQLGACNMALAGGVSFMMPDQVGYVYQEGMILSKDGHCRTFDKEASGTTGGSGVGVVLLKRLDDAVKDGDAILGVIKGYATNNDGDRKTSYTAPSVIGQSECIINAQRMAGINSNEIDYVECHGTATPLGDPIEIKALREAFVFNQNKEKQISSTTVLGAVKANIGHSDSAAGVAGLIKVCSMFQNNIIPGQVNFNSPNPELHLKQTNFEILKENRSWLPHADKQRLAGVSAFGLGGTNAHIIIGDYIPVRKRKKANKIIPQNNVNYIVPISAKSKQSLERYRHALLNYLTEEKRNEDLLRIEDVAYTLQERREQFNYREAYCAMDINELIRKLRKESVYGQANTEENPKVVFMFPGQGGQYTHMAKALYDNEPVFRTTIDKCIAIANNYLGVDLYDVIYPGEGSPVYNINEIQWSAISLFVIEYALSTYLENLGVKADAYIGHSFGEYAAATLSGVFSLEDAIKVVIARGRLMQSMEPGSMLAINASETAMKKFLSKHDCELAVINSPEDIVASGCSNAIQKLQETLEKQGVPVVKINGLVAGHSKLMEKAAMEFEHTFSNLKLHISSKTFVSNLTGEIANEEVTTSGYWCAQLRNTVQFSKGIHTISKKFNQQVCFIEVGPGKGLSYFINNYKKTGNCKSIQTVQLFPSVKEAKENKHNHFNNKEELVGKLWINGIIEKPNNHRLFNQAKLKTGLPVYQFDFQKCWINKAPHSLANKDKSLLVKKFKREISMRPDLTNEDLVSILEKILDTGKQIVTAEIIQEKIKIREEGYTKTEYQMAQIFCEILGLNEVSLHDCFFRLGGNSLAAIRLSHRMSKELDFEIRVADVFKYSTCNKLSSFVAKNINKEKLTYVEDEL